MNVIKGSSLALLPALLIFVACAQKESSPVNLSNSSANGLRPLTEPERASDFDAMVTAIRDFYAPLEYKEKRFGFKFDDLVRDYRSEALAAKTDSESLGVMKKFLARLHDGHVSIRTDVQKSTSYNVPLFITPVENRVLVAKVLDPEIGNQTGIDVGDEILEVDGKAPLSYLPVIEKYSSFATPESNRHLIYALLRRPTYMTELVPQSSTVELKIAKPNGTISTRTLIWTIEKNDLYVDRDFVTKGPVGSAYSAEVEAVLQGSLNEFGAEMPFFLTPQAKNALQIVQVWPSEAALKRHGFPEHGKIPQLFAGLYRFNGKSILMIRMARYAVKDRAERIAWYKAILDEYGRLADSLVIDQTHNPGGIVEYAQDFLAIFANEHTAGMVNFLHADRRWLADFGKETKESEAKGELKNVIELGYKLVESAYDRGLKLTESPISFSALNYIQPSAFTFRKPILLLIDELSGSCGDVVPMLMKNNHLATTFGARTMGLGGNVEPTVVLPNSQATVRLTRGFFYTYSPTGIYDLENPIENNGVTPDIPYSHTVDDVRSGYVKFVTEFSKAAAALQ